MEIQHKAVNPAGDEMTFVPKVASLRRATVLLHLLCPLKMEARIGMLLENVSIQNSLIQERGTDDM